MKPPNFEWAAIPPTTLNIPLCLTSGQFFVWERPDERTWLFHVRGTSIALQPEDSGFWWATRPAGAWDVLSSFFALDVELPPLRDYWKKQLPMTVECFDRTPGLRILRQEPEAALLQFLCSSCNNVPRITRMLRALVAELNSVVETPWGPCPCIPSLSALQNVSENRLRELGFGYRASFLRAISFLQSNSFRELEHMDTGLARAWLMGLPGVGPKVADCVCLFGLGRDAVVPVDTHVRRFVTTYLRPDLAGRSMTQRTYETIAETFRGIMGDYAGWAQQYVYVWSRSGERPA